jgi:hypothetical protein
MIGDNLISSFNLEVKRGIFWSKRKVTIDNTKLKYFCKLLINLASNNLRFESNLSDIEIIEESSKLVIINSKSK